MACKCKMKELFPIRPALERPERKLTCEELVNMRLHKGNRPIRV